MARQGLRTKGGTGIWVWVLVAFGVFLVSAMASVDEPRNLRRTETTPEEVSQGAQMQVDDTGRVIADLRAMVNAITTEKNNLVGEYDNQQTTIRQLHAALVDAQTLQKASADALETELQLRQAEAAQTAARITQMQQDAQALADRARTLQQQMLAVDEENADLKITGRLARQNQRIQQLEGQASGSEQQLVLYQGQKDAAEAESGQFQAQVQQLQAQLQQLTRQKEEAERQIVRTLSGYEGDSERVIRRDRSRPYTQRPTPQQRRERQIRTAPTVPFIDPTTLALFDDAQTVKLPDDEDDEDVLCGIRTEADNKRQVVCVRKSSLVTKPTVPYAEEEREMTRKKPTIRTAPTVRWRDTAGGDLTEYYSGNDGRP
jgi:hypothetical protein